jgi:hypothetical protein
MGPLYTDSVAMLGKYAGDALGPGASDRVGGCRLLYGPQIDPQVVFRPGETELFADIPPMGFHRGRRNEQVGPYLLVCHAISDHGSNP